MSRLIKNFSSYIEQLKMEGMILTQKDNLDNFLKFAKEKIGVEFESPRKIFGRRILPQNFKIVEVNDNR